VPSALTWLVAAVVLLLPPVSVVGLTIWAGRLRRRGAPRFIVWSAFGLAALAGLVVVGGLIGGLVTGIVGTTGTVGGMPVEPSQKARALAQGISEVMNCAAFGFLIALAGVVGLAIWRWLTRQR
jgi:hypothetical protein